MSEQKYRARTRVTVSVEVAADSVWEGNCTVDQITATAAKEAVGTITRLFEGHVRQIRVVGQPHVEVVVVLEDK